MEALAAVGLAANVLQFVDFTQSLITGTIELHSSLKSARAEHLVLEDITQQLKQFAQRLLVPEAYEEENLSEDDLALKNLATQCIKISNELLSALHGLKVKSGSNILESFYRSLKGEWKKDEIKYLQLKLDRINQHITSRLLPSQISRMEGRLKNMMVQDRHLQARRSGDIDKLATELKLFMEELRSGETRKMPMSSLSAVVEKGTGYLAEQVILKCLRFESINNRHTSIPHAHHETFRWAFDDSAPAELVQWLRGNGLLYWISGKPGSGKSTFMKHLSRHHDTIKCLRDWANGEKLITADFFFWNADKNSLAKSQEGLLRSIMYQILRELPSQISQVFPDQWSMILSGISSRFEVCQHVQTPEELRRALARLTAHLPNTSSKFCLFIDGLDEYEGRPSDIIQAIKLLRLENVKLCVSSRSWNEFEHFFEDASGKLYMQDLTKEDIRLYVSDTFEQNPQFKDLVASEGRGRSEELVQDIIEAAQGVFLWVVLVVRSLLEGLDNADKFIYLKKRLREFPRDLDTFFERILFTVDEFYRGQTFPMFLTTLAACDLLPVMCYWFIDQLHDDANYAIELAVKPLTMQQIYIRRKTMGKRLNAYCKGLLEVQFVRTGQDDSLSSSILFDSRVDFLHRTARDFLRTPSAQLQLQNQLRPDFNAELTICHAILAQLKTIPQDKQLFASVGPVSNLLYLFFYHATALEDDGIPPETELQLISELHNTITNHAAAVSKGVVGQLGQVSVDAKSSYVLPGCARWGLRRYIAHVMEPAHATDPLDLALVLENVLRPAWIMASRRPRPPHEDVRFIIERGANFNSICEVKTVWEGFISEVACRPPSASEEDQYNVYCMLRVLVEHGADLGVTCLNHRERRTAWEVAHRVLDRQQADELIGLWQRAKADMPSKNAGIRAIIRRVFRGK